MGGGVGLGGGWVAWNKWENGSKEENNKQPRTGGEKGDRGGTCSSVLPSQKNAILSSCLLSLLSPFCIGVSGC